MTIIKRRLRVRAAEHGRTMEEEAREILRLALSARPAHPRNLGPVDPRAVCGASVGSIRWRSRPPWLGRRWTWRSETRLWKWL
jgi:hypothetical protein